ncbi:unnamed protein product [Prunus brigantina]
MTLRRTRSVKFSEKSRQPPFFLTSSLSPKQPFSQSSPQPTAPSEKGPGRHNLRSPEVPPTSPSKFPPKKAWFGRFFADCFLSPPATNSDAREFSGDCYRFGHPHAVGACGGVWGL